MRVRVGSDTGHEDKPWATVVSVVGKCKAAIVGDRR